MAMLAAAVLIMLVVVQPVSCESAAESDPRTVPSSSTWIPATSHGRALKSGSTVESVQEAVLQQQYNSTGALTVDYYTPATSTDDPAASTVGLLAESAQVSAACPVSSLGYQCSTKVADGVTLHYSYGAGQPGNSCTQNAGLDTSLGSGTTLMHFAIESTQPVRGIAGV